MSEEPRISCRSDDESGGDRYRKHWYQLWLPLKQAVTPPPSLASASMTPLANASFVSVLTYAWLTPLIILGWQRTLQAQDLWRVRTEEEAGPLSELLDKAWARRVERPKQSSQERGRKLKLVSSIKDNEPSLALALNDVL
ncbi:unnamed protein product, partial [Rhizoctonia solani]